MTISCEADALILFGITGDLAKKKLFCNQVPSVPGGGRVSARNPLVSKVPEPSSSVSIHTSKRPPEIL